MVVLVDCCNGTFGVRFSLLISEYDVVMFKRGTIGCDCVIVDVAEFIAFI